ncbi:hypothetical protein EDEG_01361 [Edhazardia aedis USNM 41457]|uniref:Uncharacterized protein n=1 Tax=Edhazardia aedis (strain USNM 41457) TaxID=1003232 RepID=J9DSV1_EDHAE|nr:hypothetical protein EDEG_01361 [Edhazardia aedis USNM 41457]|eukprot:EJW04397.1 hypothetical protein EDEG_01361 [Edhazardia aedis USNM 41457]
MISSVKKARLKFSNVLLSEIRDTISFIILIFSTPSNCAIQINRRSINKMIEIREYENLIINTLKLYCIKSFLLFQLNAQTQLTSGIKMYFLKILVIINNKKIIINLL